ncbi:MAG: M20/M25/M40 family metallo-hydrolase [Pyrinomonadaceae bacterium]|nr:M20/M25/M40 family metallo-hydrolase [Pyrinomonadaceae bacterium]
MKESNSQARRGVVNIFKLTRELVDIPSLTSDEREVGLFLASYLDELGYRVELQELEEGRSNVIATTADAAPRVMLSTHMDTVPPHIPSSEDAQFIYGRGSCDAKGIIAAQVAAAERLRAEGINELGLLFTVDEEMGSRGAALLNKHPLARNCCYMINGEPTDNRLAVGTKGSLRLILKTRGRAAHSAYPEQGESAIEKLLDVLRDVRACEWPGDSSLGETTCNIGVIKGGTRSNVIPAEAEADLQLRLVTEGGPVREILERAVGGRAEISYLSEAAPIRLVTLDGFEQCAVRFMTDIPHLSNWGAPLLLGPGSILVAHTDEERINKQELEQAVELYTRLVHTLLKKSGES